MRVFMVARLLNVGPSTYVRQPFLTPIPPLGSDTVAQITLPLSYALAVTRTVVIVAIAAVYFVFVSGLCTVLVRGLPPDESCFSPAQKPIPPIHRAISYVFTALLSRLSLFVLGLWWIRVEEVSRKRGFVTLDLP